jgi:hypothetical protein
MRLGHAATAYSRFGTAISQLAAFSWYAWQVSARFPSAPSFVRPQDHPPALEYLGMSNRRLAILAAVSLAVGGLLGLAGSFSPPAIRGVAWGLDGTALVMGALLLAVHHIKLGNEQLAAGFFTFVAGQTLVVSSSAMNLAAS